MGNIKSRIKTIEKRVDEKNPENFSPFSGIGWKATKIVYGADKAEEEDKISWKQWQRHKQKFLQMVEVRSGAQRAEEVKKEKEEEEAIIRQRGGFLDEGQSYEPE